MAATNSSAATSAAADQRPSKPPTSYTPMSSADEAKLKAKALSAAKPDTGKQELVGDRTRMSRTFADPVTGTRVTQLSAAPINFQNAGGDWQPIDNTLKADKPAVGGRTGRTTTPWSCRSHWWSR
ncbi:hypothetical protein [Kineosporia sp. NBRC 101731]|uniref:hypothetical protein n=1 Tax=Kineosporia sp. NBRC 101731 TaxID=3032199 RepID=UPI002554B7B1|nr:hypothetical protein [Kineosporia sp. NBRC 101731]